MFTKESEIRSKKNILADDHGGILHWLIIHFESLGWDAIPARSGREVLEKIRINRPALIVLDMEMGEVEGFEVARFLKKHPNYRRIPILAATALTSPKDRDRCYGAGCDDFIAKPFTFDDLKQHVNRLLSTVNGQAAGRL